jgi:hypothetical protein
MEINVRASPPVLSLVCDPAKVFLITQFSYPLFFFCNSAHKTETGTANNVGNTN